VIYEWSTLRACRRSISTTDRPGRSTVAGMAWISSALPFRPRGHGLAEAGSSFRGIRIQPPTANWGSMVFSGFPWMTVRPVVIMPSVLIATIMLAFPRLSDGLRDALDQRMSGEVQPLTDDRSLGRDAVCCRPGD